MAMPSSSSEIILTSSPDGPIAAHDHLTGAIVSQYSATRSPRNGLAFASGELIAASHISLSASGFIYLFNWWSSSVLQSIPVPEPVAPLVATPQGSYLFAGGLSGSIYILSLPSGDVFHSFRAHRQPVSCLTINADGSLLLSRCDDGMIAVFPIISLLDISSVESNDHESIPALYQFTAHNMSVTGIASGTGGCKSIFITCSLDCTIKFWSLANGACLRNVHLECGLWSVIVDSTNVEAYVGGSDGRVYMVPLKMKRRRFSSEEDQEVVAWPAEESGGAVIALVMLNGDRNVASASEDGVVTIWDSRQVVRVVRYCRSSISGLLVAKGVSRATGVRRDVAVGFNVVGSMSLEEGMCKEVKEVEVEECLNVVVKDRRRAIDSLEEAINTYKKLLCLLLKEARGG